MVPALAILGGVATLRADTPTPTPPAQPALSAADMQTRMTGLQTQISDDARHMLYLKEQAKKQKDVIKLSCVNDKLVQFKAQQNIADTTVDQLQVALAKNSDERNSLFAEYTSTAEAVKRLREEAASCIGAPELYKQESGNTYYHPDFPDDPHGTFGFEVEPPAYCSPFN
jgi:hypothetical protein